MSDFLGAGEPESAVALGDDPTAGSADVALGGPALPDETTLAMWRDWSSTA